MPDMKMVEVRPEQVDELAALAKPIWTDHFTPIIGAEQTAYMIEKFQSAPAMRAQMEHDGYHYYFSCMMGRKRGIQASAVMGTACSSAKFMSKSPSAAGDLLL